MFKRSDERAMKMGGDQQGRLNTILGDESNINGTLRVEGSVRIDGEFDGVIVATETIVIGRTGLARADLEAREILVSGRVEGKLVATGRVELQDGARVDGDVFSQSFMIADGVVFNGRCNMEVLAPEAGAEVTSAMEVVDGEASGSEIGMGGSKRTPAPSAV